MAIPPNQLVTFQELPDGNLEATLQRYGRLVVRLPNSPLALEISVKRDAKRNFRCFVATTLSGEEKQNEATRKANGGLTPEKNHILGIDGCLNPTAHEKDRKQSTGRKAANAAARESGSEPGSQAGGSQAGGSQAGGTGAEGGAGE